MSLLSSAAPAAALAADQTIAAGITNTTQKAVTCHGVNATFTIRF